MELASNFLRTRTASLGNLFNDVILRHDVKNQELPASPNTDALISKPELIVNPDFIFKSEVASPDKSEMLGASKQNYFFPSHPEPMASSKSETPTISASSESGTPTSLVSSKAATPTSFASSKSGTPSSFTSSLAPRCLKPDVQYAQPDVCNVKATPVQKPDVCAIQRPDICAQADEGSANKYARKDSKSAAENHAHLNGRNRARDQHHRAHHQHAQEQQHQQQHHAPQQKHHAKQQQHKQDRMKQERLKQYGDQSSLPNRIKAPSTANKSKVSSVGSLRIFAMFVNLGLTSVLMEKRTSSRGARASCLAVRIM